MTDRPTRRAVVLGYARKVLSAIAAERPPPSELSTKAGPIAAWLEADGFVGREPGGNLFVTASGAAELGLPDESEQEELRKTMLTYSHEELARLVLLGEHMTSELRSQNAKLALIAFTLTTCPGLFSDPEHDTSRCGKCTGARQLKDLGVHVR